MRNFPNATFDSEHKTIDTAGGGRSPVSFLKLVVPTSNVQVLLSRAYIIRRGVHLNTI